MSSHDFARRVHAFLLALFIVFGAAVPAALFMTPEAEAETTYTYTDYHPYSDYIRFKCNGMTGTCIQPANLNTREGKATLTKLSNTNQLARIAYYYGVVKKWDTSKANAYWLKTMLQVTNEPNKARTVITTAKINKAKGYIDKIPSDLKVPDNFEIYRGDPTNGQQDFVVWKLTPPGQVRLIKTSTDAKAAKVGGYDFKGIQ